MTTVEIISLVVTIVCLVCFSAVFTILFRHYYKSNIDSINSGNEDIDLIDNAIEEEKAKKSKVKKAGRITLKVIGYIILILVLVVFGISLYSRFSGNIIPFGDTAYIVIASGSMSEANSSNDYLYTYNLDNQFDQYDIIGITKYDSQDDVQLYDVVAYYNDDGDIIVHRIIDITTNSSGETVYTTRGDANSSSDNGSQYSSYLSYDNIIGYYNGTRIKGLGIFVIFLQSNAGIITIIAVAYCLLMFDYYNTKYDKAIVDRTNKLIDLLDYDPSSKEDASDVTTIYKEELIYKDTIYTFIKGEYISKEEIKDENTRKKIQDTLVYIKQKEEEEASKKKEKHVFIKKVDTNDVTEIKTTEEDVNKIVDDSIELPNNEVEESKEEKVSIDKDIENNTEDSIDSTKIVENDDDSKINN